MAIKNIFIKGAGTMGAGIAQVASQAGYAVTLMDISEESLSRALAGTAKGLDRLVAKAVIQKSDKDAILSRIKPVKDLTAIREADLVIEAIPEILAMKLAAFEEFDRLCPPNTILASNTSALPISAIAAATKRQDRVVGIHFMNPVPLIKGVEVIPGRHTSDAVLKIAKDFVVSLGKEPCEVRDYAGFVVSRLLDVLMNEAIRCVMDGNKPEEVDKAMRLCCNFPMGPLELCDLVGADITLHGTETMLTEFGERLQPAPLLKSMVRAGDLGRKTGRGFYDHTPKK